jgi:ATP-dependent Clp protease ATP-binding subunit ClpA
MELVIDGITAPLARAIDRAHNLASQFGDGQVRPEHFLLSLMTFEDLPVNQTLKRYGLTYELLADKINQQKKPKKTKTKPKANAKLKNGGPDFDRESISILESAKRQAMELDRCEAQSEHLLLALLREETGCLPLILKDLNVNSVLIRCRLVGNLVLGRDTETGHAVGTSYNHGSGRSVQKFLINLQEASQPKKRRYS